VDVDARVAALILEYSVSPPTGRLDPKASLRDDLGVDSLSLVSVALALGDSFGIDLVEWGADMSKLATVGDLIALGHALARASPSTQGTSPKGRSVNHGEHPERRQVEQRAAADGTADAGAGGGENR
jgi:acyl carrier protein